MKISSSKKELARIISENGGWRDGAEWSIQDSDKNVEFMTSRPEYMKSSGAWYAHASRIGAFKIDKLLPNWHQTILSRDEYFFLYQEQGLEDDLNEDWPDADGWIEWKGGECPVGEDDLIDVKFSDGDALFGVDSSWDWDEDVDGCNIIAYRPHKMEQAKPKFCESVMRSTPEPATTPTLDQLLQDWRNADDYAHRKHAEADEAAAMRDERWQAVQARAGEMGVTIDHATEEHSDEVLQITKHSQLEIGDVIWIGRSGVKEDERRLPEGEYQVVKVGTVGVLHNGVTFYPDFSFRSWRFISRP